MVRSVLMVASLCVGGWLTGWLEVANANGSAESPTTAIDLKLENPFRLFRDAKDFERLRMRQGETVQAWYLRHASSIGEGYLPTRRTWWDPVGGHNTDGQYQPGYLHPSSHRVTFSLPGEPPGALCNWELESRPTELGASIPAQRRESAFSPAALQRRIAAGPCEGTTLDVAYEQPDTNGVGRPFVITAASASGKRATRDFQIRDVLVLGLGDSYSAGEGAPDEPAQLTAHDPRLSRSSILGNVNVQVLVPEVTSGRVAQWWDNECHRSLLSWQPLAALRLASQHADRAGKLPGEPLVAITFASYACSGAEVWDGMLQPQKNPPGHTKRPAQNGTAAFVQRSQLHAASKDLCEVPSGDWVVGSGLKQHRFANCGGWQRSPDLVFMSIGGNDAGFAKVIMHTLVPGPSLGNTAVGATALAAFKKVLGTVDNDEAAARAARLKEKLPLLSTAMEERLRVRPGTVFFMQYPDPLQRPLRIVPASDDDTCGLELRSGTEAARFMSSALKDHWHMWGTASEFRAIRSEVIRPLHEVVRASRGHWTVVDGHLPDFLEHGLCADAAAAERDDAGQAQMADIANIRIYGLPAVSVEAGAPKDWRLPQFFDGAYNPALARWFRTPNDSVRVQTERRVQDSMAGAFHPNGGGYARLADAAVEAVTTAAGQR